MSGGLALVLHAHLPFVRHPEHPRFHEETWLFEAILECYLPLLGLMEGWERDGVPWALTMAVSPVLGAMLRDPLLRSRFESHLESLAELAAREEERHLLQPREQAVARWYSGRIAAARSSWRRLGGDLPAAFAGFARTGRLELLTCAATHALLPLLVDEPAALRAQLRVAVRAHRELFGVAPRGIWLPECAYVPELDPFLAAEGLRWFVVESHGILLARPSSPHAAFGPVVTPGGLAAFGRDPASARQVWSRDGGYPGDPRYREFHRDIAHDAEWGYVAPYLGGAQSRGFTGLKYHRVTGAGAAKELYVREEALAAVRQHAAHFVAQRSRQFAEAAPCMRRPPLLVAPYDAELFGHWWHEGPEFLDAVMRGCADGRAGFVPTTLAGYLARHPSNPVAIPARSSWGDGGQLGVWLGGSNAWMQTHLRVAARRMSAMVRDGIPAAGWESRALAQAGRELLLAQASDWPFLVAMGTAAAYARRRFEDHVSRFNRLHAQLTGAEPRDAAWLAEIESRDNLFPWLDPGAWA